MGTIIPGPYELWCRALLNQSPDPETGEFWLDECNVQIELLPLTELQYASDRRETVHWKGFVIKYPMLGYSDKHTIFVPLTAKYHDFAVLVEEIILKYAEDEIEWEERLRRIRNLNEKHQTIGGAR